MSNTREFMVYGCPGGGKTTYVARQARRAAQKFGSSKVIICSLTKAAASEAAGRDTALSEQNIGTLHSFCYRAMGSPQMAESREHIASWNNENSSLQITPTTGDGDSGIDPMATGLMGGDRLLAKVNLRRARLTPFERWLPNEQKFYKRWCAWKNANDLVDFADLIDYGRQEMLFPPGRPRVIFIDEAQDLSAAELDLLQTWVSHTEQVIYVGDSDQSLYDWRGASPEVMRLSRFPEENVKKLNQSHRVPVKVREEAMRLIRLTERNELDYKPVEREGEVTVSSATYKTVVRVLGDVLRDTSQKTMILCTCGYMVNDVAKQLREAGIPFHNPYVKRWNPISTKGISMARRLAYYLKPSSYNPNPEFWTPMEVYRVIEKMAVRGTLNPKAKQQVEMWPPIMSADEIARRMREIINPLALEEFFDFNPDWWAERLATAAQKTVHFPLRILKAMGYEALIAEPSVILGTIHSVKGGEADTVIVFPDLSQKGAEQYSKHGFAYRDAILRMFYVAFTRSRNKLIIGSPVKIGKATGQYFAKEVYPR